MKTTLLRLTTAGIIATAIALPSSGVFAHGGDHSTCADVGFLGVHVHGDHVVRDYVQGSDGAVGHGDAAIPRWARPRFPLHRRRVGAGCLVLQRASPSKRF